MNPIFIHRGDCVVFADITDFLTFMIDSDLDLTNWKAEFHLGIIVKKYDDITSKVVKVILSAEETKTLKLGEWNGALVLIDAKGHRKTIINTIPFVITDEVVENSYQTIDLTIPETAGVDVTLKVGTASVTSINGMSGEVILTAQDVGALPNTTKIPDVSGLATKQELTNGLATKQAKGDYALVSDIPSLDDYVKNTDYATRTDFGLVRPANGLTISGVSGSLIIEKASKAQIDKKEDNYYPIVSSNLNYAVNSVLPTMTQAEYDALETKDENLFYMIVEE